MKVAFSPRHKTLKLCLLLCLSVCLHAVSFGQNVTISGNVTDADNGEDLIGATVSIAELENVGIATNVYGFYSLTVPAGSYTVRFQFIGYQGLEKQVTLSENTKLNVELTSSAQSLTEVVVSAEKGNENVTSTEMSITKLDPKSIEAVPVLLGEKDVIKTMQLTPGVKSAGEGNAGFFVRGGGVDQNLILLDEAPVYNASHLLGFFSVFNSDAIKDVKLYKGGIPAKYGGRGSSVMDITMRDGNNKKLGVSGGIGLISSRLTIEAPIVKDKGSFIISGRRSYADLFLKLSSQEGLKNSSLYFYDLNMKANYRFSDKDRLYVSGYFGRDNFGFSDVFGFDWGNGTGTIRWNHLFNDRLFSNTSLIYSNYNYSFQIGTGDEAFGIRSAIQDINLKEDFSYFLNSKNTIKFGANIIHHTFAPGELFGNNESFNTIKFDDKKAYEGGAYIQNEQEVSPLLSLQYGLRYSYFNQFGGVKSTYSENGSLLTRDTLAKGEGMQAYHGIEPRLAATYILTESSSLKGSYNKNYQYLHLLSNATSSAPTDLWVPTSNNVKPQIIDQVAIGYFRNFKDNTYEFSVETYYKTLQNQIDYRPQADLVLNSDVEGELLYGKGKAYGVEFYLQKKKGKFTGWLSYTLSRSLRQFEGVNNGDWLSARQDRIHDIALVGIYQLSEKLTLSGSFVYYTGDAITVPAGKYNVEGISVPRYTERNRARFPNYHRFDLGLTWYRKKTEKLESSWNFSIYNMYGRENAYVINFAENEETGITEARQISLFKIIPSVTYNFKF